MLARLERRLDLLAGGAADLPERQRTLRATLDWSYRLLEEAEQLLLARLSVFDGGATLDAVEAVCVDAEVPEVLGTLSSLLEKSLLVSAEAGVGQPRLRLLQVVRDYAAEHLAERGEQDLLRERHARWYIDLAEPANVAVHSDGHHHWPMLESEVDNLRAAGRWVLETADLVLATTLAERTWTWVWHRGRLPEVREWLEQLLPLLDDDVDPGTAGRLAYIAAQARFMLGDVTGAAPLIEEALALLRRADDRPYVAVARMTRATIMVGLGRLEGVAADADAAVEAAVGAGKAWMLGYAAAVRGSYRALTGDLTGARTDHELSLATAERIGLDALVGQAHGQLVRIHLLDADRDTRALEDARRDLGQC